MLLAVGMVVALGAGMALGVVPVPFAGTQSPGVAPDARREGGPASREAGPVVPTGLASAKPTDEDGPPAAPVDLDRADRDLDLHGVVVAGDGRRVAGARLTTVSHPGRRGGLLDPAMHALTVEGARTRSATDGTFAIRLRRGERLSLRVEARGFATRELFGCAAGQRLRVVMAPGVTCVVTLRDVAGAPVADTLVRSFRPAYASLDVFERSAVSGADGVARFEGLSGDGWAFVDPQPTRLGAVSWKRVTLPASGEVSVDIVLLKGRSIRGHVTDAKTGTGIAGARVAIGWVMTSPVLTDVEGRYEILGWHDAQGADDLHAVAEGYARSAAIVGERDVVDFPLLRGLVAIGRVVDVAGTPVSGVLVGCVDIGKESGRVDGDVNGTARTGRDGRFRLTDLRPDTPHALVFLGVGLARTLLDVAPPSTEGGTLDVGDVVLRAGRRIEGRVLDSEGRPVVGQRVGLEGANDDRARLLLVSLEGRRTSYGQEEEAYTDDLGRFRFPDLAPGSYVLSVRLPGGEIPPRTVPLGADADAVDVDLRMEDGRDLTVRVRDARGDALAQAFVSAFGPEAQGVSGVTDAKGAVALRITGGRWKVNVHWSKELDAKGRNLLGAEGVEVSDADDDVEIRLEDAGVITGVVRGPDGALLPRAIVMADAPGRRPVVALTDAEGRFALAVVASGRCTVRVTGQHDAAHPGQIVDLAGERLGLRAGDADVVVVARPLVKDRALVVVVEAPDGTPLVGAPVAVTGWDGRTRRLTSGDGGRLDVRELSPRPVDLLVEPVEGQRERWVYAQRGGVIPEGQTVALRLRVGVPIAGIVLGADGRVVAGVAVDAKPPGSGYSQLPWSSVTDADGRFRLVVDPEAGLPLLVRAMPQGVDPTTVEVPALDAADLTIRLASP